MKLFFNSAQRLEFVGRSKYLSGARFERFERLERFELQVKPMRLPQRPAIASGLST
jgi:hypothetical protein